MLSSHFQTRPKMQQGGYFLLAKAVKKAAKKSYLHSKRNVTMKKTNLVVLPYKQRVD